MRKRDQKTEGYKIKKEVYPSLPKPDTLDMVQIYFLLDGSKVLNKTEVPRSQAQPFQLIKPR